MVTHTFATFSTSTTRLLTSNVDDVGNLAVLAMAGEAGNDVVVDEGGVAAGSEAATAATTAAAGLPFPCSTLLLLLLILAVDGG